MISITKVPFRLLVLFIALAFGVTAGAIPSGKRKDKEKDKSNSPQTQQQTVSGKIDLNTASEKELDSLPGVGPATVKKIVSNRPYSSVDDLKKAGVAQAQIEQIRSLDFSFHLRRAAVSRQYLHFAIPCPLISTRRGLSEFDGQDSFRFMPSQESNTPRMGTASQRLCAQAADSV